MSRSTRQRKRKVRHGLNPNECGVVPCTLSVGKHHVLHTGCLHSNHTARVQGHYPQHLLQKNKTRGIRIEVETDQLACWLSGLSVQNGTRLCGL